MTQHRELPPTHEVKAKHMQRDDYIIWSGSGWERIVEIEHEKDETHFVLQFGDGCVVDPEEMEKIRRPCQTIYIFPDGSID